MTSENFEEIFQLITEADLMGAQGAYPPPPLPPSYFLQSFVFCNHFEELQLSYLKLNWSLIMHL